MITRIDIEQRAREWGLREEIVEKDYVLGWLLWGIGTDPVLSMQWAFKGGTCLKKCFLETYRFSEDLDFSVLPEGLATADEIRPVLERILKRVGDESGIDFTQRASSLRTLPSGRQTEGRVYYVGPRGTPSVASVKLDVSGSEVVVRPTVLRAISHSYPDALPHPGTVRCYAFEEVFAEKIRALGERGRPRDLYDIVNLFRRSELHAHVELIRSVLSEKCRAKGISVPNAATVATEENLAELESAWEDMLGHQLQALPPLKDHWDVLPAFFDWLEGKSRPEPIAAISAEQGGPLDEGWQPPPTITTWGQGIPLESVRFAAANHLCVSLGYDGSSRLIEPYSLRRTRAGNLLLFAVKADSGEIRAYRVDRIQRVEVSSRTFRPRFRVEFTSMGPLRAPPMESEAGLGGMSRVPRPRSIQVPFRIQCPYCGKTFGRKSRDSMLGEHKDPGGFRCPGSRHPGIPV